MAAQTLDGKVVVIGGGGKNLGGLISRTFGAEGARIAVHYNSEGTAGAAEDTVRAVRECGGDAFAIRGDLTKVPEVVRLFDETVRRYGTVNIAINTVGKVLKKPIVETSEDEYDEIFAVNAKAAYFFIREAAKRIPDNSNGKIITILTSLLAAFTGLYSVYAGSKAPVEHFTRAAAKELGPRGISVNNVAPGPMDTPFFYPADDAGSTAYHPAPKRGKPITPARGSDGFRSLNPSYRVYRVLSGSCSRHSRRSSDR
jgi:NAD(P)-dependent dehydrogenase (short-subunit alcohol dehydrogenase family)